MGNLDTRHLACFRVQILCKNCKENYSKLEPAMTSSPWIILLSETTRRSSLTLSKQDMFQSKSVENEFCNKSFTSLSIFHVCSLNLNILLGTKKPSLQAFFAQWRCRLVTNVCALSSLFVMVKKKNKTKQKKPR